MTRSSRIECRSDHDQPHVKTSVVSVKSVVCFIRLTSYRFCLSRLLASLKNLEKFDDASEGVFLKWLTAIVESRRSCRSVGNGTGGDITLLPNGRRDFPCESKPCRFNALIARLPFSSLKRRRKATSPVRPAAAGSAVPSKLRASRPSYGPRAMAGKRPCFRPPRVGRPSRCLPDRKHPPHQRPRLPPRLSDRR